MDFQNRQYDPQIGRFLSIDPLADDGQEEWSPYAAMGNNPAMMVDPLGLKFDMGVVANPHVMTPQYDMGGKKNNTPGANEMNGEWLAGDIAREREMQEDRERERILGEGNNVAFWSGVLTAFTLSPGNFTLSNVGNGKFISNDFKIATAGSGLMADGGAVGLGAGMAVWAEVAAAGTAAIPGLVVGAAGIVAVGGVYLMHTYISMSEPGFGIAGTEYSGVPRAVKEFETRLSHELARHLAEQTADQLLPGSLKKSPSYNPKYGGYTRTELEALAKKGDAVAGKMKKLVDQIPRLLEKNKNK